MAKTDLEPTPSKVELVKDNPFADSVWKTWLNKVYSWIRSPSTSGDMTTYDNIDITKFASMMD